MIQIMNTIKMIRTKDPKIYDKSTSFYSKHESDNDSSDESGDDSKKTSKKKTFKDVLREQLLEDKQDSDSDDGRSAKLNQTSVPKSALLYDKEQESIRKSFLKLAGEEGDSPSGSDDDDVLRVKPKDPADQAREEEELRRAIDEAFEVEKSNRADASSKADEEQFLANYMRQKKWIDPTGASMRELRAEAREGARVMTVEEEDRLLDLDEDEQELEEVDKFESKYNFRFEELQGQGADGGPGAGHAVEVAGHARNVEGSLRRVDDTRKKQREARKERKVRDCDEMKLDAMMFLIVCRILWCGAGKGEEAEGG
jgi:protein KRI1